ncbi:MAG: RNA polymerase subunit sigma-24 [Brevibacillus sp.]|jgi:RNA polymerase sigma-70 factor, ECF subfamily|nr:MAG: RNA polymerase subunit sigma-24 [Brevibacillus sp.]
MTDFIEKAKKGDGESFVQAIMQVKDRAYRVAYSYLNDQEASMDAVCDAVEKAFLHLDTLRDDRYFSSWFIRIVINECKAQLQKRQRALTLSQRLSGEPEYETPAREEVMDVQALLNRLAPLDRLLIFLKFFDGYTLDEIAELTQLPVGTVKTKIYSNLKRLKRILEAEGV